LGSYQQTQVNTNKSD